MNSAKMSLKASAKTRVKLHAVDVTLRRTGIVHYHKRTAGCKTFCSQTRNNWLNASEAHGTCCYATTQLPPFSSYSGKIEMLLVEPNLLAYSYLYKTRKYPTF